MHSERTLDRLDDDAATELQQAVRDNDAVELDATDVDGLTLRGETDGFDRLQQSLWIRELTAREHGQDDLAEADQTARIALQRAVTEPSPRAGADAEGHATTLSD